MSVAHRPRLLIVSRADPFASRPQPIQVLRAAAGIAAAGAQVTLVMDAAGSQPADRETVEAHLGMALGERLQLHLIHGRHPGARGLRRRALLMRLMGQRWDAALTRDLRVLRQLARLRRWPGRSRPGHTTQLLLEWHAIPTALGERDEGERQAAAIAGGHVYVSAGLAEEVHTRFSPSARGVVLPNACEPLQAGVAARRLDGLARARAVVCAGLARPPADDPLLGAVARALPDDLELRVIGPPAGPAVSPAAADAALDGALCQLALYREDLNTRRFASPLKVAQARATGVPLVASDVPTVRALVEPGRTALLAAPGDAGAVRSAILSLAGDRHAARQLAERALEGVAGHTWTDRGAALLALLEAP